jgi:hypothetical protein
MQKTLQYNQNSCSSRFGSQQDTSQKEVEIEKRVKAEIMLVDKVNDLDKVTLAFISEVNESAKNVNRRIVLSMLDKVSVRVKDILYVLTLPPTYASNSIISELSESNESLKAKLQEKNQEILRLSAQLLPSFALMNLDTTSSPPGDGSESPPPIPVYNSSNPESKTSFVIGTLPFLRVDEDESLPQYPVDNAPFPESKTSFIGEESFLGRVHEVVPSREVSFVMENTVNEEPIGIVEPHHHDGKLFSYSSTFLSPLCVFFLFR